MAGHVPAMYVHFAHQFLSRVAGVRAEERVSYREYSRDGWTFHGKGLWLYPSGQDLPALSLVGSSNYGSNIRLVFLYYVLFILQVIGH